MADRLTVLTQVAEVAWVELMILPRADPVVIDLSSNRRVEVAHHDTDLPRLSKSWPLHFHLQTG
jgi:hypothetical protein